MTKKIEPVTPDTKPLEPGVIGYTEDGFPIMETAPVSDEPATPENMSTGVRKIMAEAAAIKRAPKAVYKIEGGTIRRDN